jgi:hypothetical protein
LKVKQIQYPGINSSRDEVSEETYEQAEMQIEGYLYQLKEVGTEILGEEGFERQFGKEVESIKDNMRDGRFQSRRFIPHDEIERAGKLQDQLAEAVSKLEKPSAGKSPALVDRLRDIEDNNVNDNGDSIDDLNRRYWEGDEYIPFEELPKGGFREQVIAAFIDAKAAGYYDEPGRLRGPYDRPSNKMTDKGYAKARAHALKGNMDNSPSDLDEYWDDNSSIFWDEYAMITDQYPKDE